jgi:hypothetical protein
MICPSCGRDNPEGSPACSECHYRFEFLHGHGDPSAARFLNFSNLKTPGRKRAAAVLLIVAASALVLAVLAWLTGLK